MHREPSNKSKKTPKTFKFKVRDVAERILRQIFGLLHQEVLFWGKSRETYYEDGLWTQHAHDFIKEPTFLKSYNHAISATGGTDYRIAWRTHVYIWAAKHAMKTQGDFIELGVGKGWMVSAALPNIEWNNSGKNWWLFDRFTANEVDPMTGALQSTLKTGRYTVNLETVKKNFEGYEKLQFIEGTIPDSLVHLRCKEISFLHIDLNAAAPEIEALEILWPRIIQGGVVLLDNFGFPMHEKQKEAMKKLSVTLGFDILYLPTGQGLILEYNS